MTRWLCHSGIDSVKAQYLHRPWTSTLHQCHERWGRAADSAAQSALRRRLSLSGSSAAAQTEFCWETLACLLPG